MQINFYSLPPQLVRYILKYADSPINRKVCVAWRRYYGNIYYDRLIQIENDPNEPKKFTERLTIFRKDSEEKYPKLKNDGFKLIHLFFKELTGRWDGDFHLDKNLQLNTIRDHLYYAINNEALIKFTGKWAVNKAIEEIKTQRLGYCASKCNLDHLPSEIEFLNVSQLYLNDNRLTELPEAIVKTDYLFKLELSHNCFVKFPMVLCSLKNLGHLDLSDNRLKEIPLEIGKLENLQVLHLHGNKLKELPLEICYLLKLKKISLWGNKPSGQKRITKIPTAYAPYSSKRKARAMQNNLEEQLNLFFNLTLLKAERATKALNPLSNLYKEFTISENKPVSGLKFFTSKLSNEDRNLFYQMIVVCEKANDPFSELLNKNYSDEQNCRKISEEGFKVSQEVFDQALIETIFQKAEKERSDDIEMDCFPKLTTDKNLLEELQRINLMDLANKK